MVPEPQHARMTSPATRIQRQSSNKPTAASGAADSSASRSLLSSSLEHRTATRRRRSSSSSSSTTALHGLLDGGDGELEKRLAETLARILFGGDEQLMAETLALFRDGGDGGGELAKQRLAETLARWLVAADETLKATVQQLPRWGEHPVAETLALEFALVATGAVYVYNLYKQMELERERNSTYEDLETKWRLLKGNERQAFVSMMCVLCAFVVVVVLCVVVVMDCYC